MSGYPQSRRSEAAIGKNKHPCTNCRNQKLGCAGGPPCARCVKRGIPCIKSAPVEVSRLRRNSSTSGYIGISPGAQRGTHWVNSSPAEMQNSFEAAADPKHGKQVGFQHPRGPSQPQFIPPAPAGFPQGSQGYPNGRIIVDTFRVGTDVNSSVVTIYELCGERYVSTTDYEHGHPLPMQKPDTTLEEYLQHMMLAGGVADQAYASAVRSLQHTPPHPVRSFVDVRVSSTTYSG
ncbi:hypothetical protein BD410DRAFT_886451 [Rickenella mellea]|uniref:Zn(2)-C6 fungal-type domain-containing protein n=1 Tax=Rickenella mellea TaxID=50990 RepID=A0A4Y7PNG8_9AGAM|nr:hypothetical protein BD410DRAFT_886451 [Rickenella mellea]